MITFTINPSHSNDAKNFAAKYDLAFNYIREGEHIGLIKVRIHKTFRTSFEEWVAVFATLTHWTLYVKGRPLIQYDPVNLKSFEEVAYNLTSLLNLVKEGFPDASA